MDRFEFYVTQYEGCEDYILNLRNRNRDSKKYRNYFDWRYNSSLVKNKPKIFLIKNNKNIPIGMASIIYRHFWIDNKKIEMMVLGDISIDREYRGKGLAIRLFEYMNKILSQENEYFAFVIPNLAAKKALEKAGWKNVEKINQYTLWINPENKIINFIRNKYISSIICKIYQNILKYLLSYKSDLDCSVLINSCIDDEIEIMWKEYNKKGKCIGDKSLQKLNWRYFEHSLKEYKIAKCLIREKVISFYIFNIVYENRTCHIYDYLVKDTDLNLISFRMFINELKKKYQLDSIRITMSQSNIYKYGLNKLGFIKSRSNDVFQIYSSNINIKRIKNLKWIIFSGDKDTI